MAFDLYSLPIQNLEEEHIDRLIEGRQSENRYLDFKRYRFPRNDKDVPQGKKTMQDFIAELSRDVTSFANTEGGHILFGVGQGEDGSPFLEGITDLSYDKETLRLKDLINDNAKPRILGFEFKEIRMGEKGSVLVLRIPKSLNGPHQITSGSGQFFSRNATGKQNMDYTELRNVFLANASFLESAREWRDRRLEIVRINKVPAPIYPAVKLVMHFVPISFQNPLTHLDVKTLEANNRWLESEVGHRAVSGRFNADGYLVSAKHYGDQSYFISYAQAFRKGQLECVTTVQTEQSDNGERLITAPLFNKLLMQEFSNRVKFCQESGVSLPILVSISLLNLRGCRFQFPSHLWTDPTARIEEEEIIAGELVLPDWPDQEAIKAHIKPVLDCVWNAAGRPEAPEFPN